MFIAALRTVPEREQSLCQGLRVSDCRPQSMHSRVI
jgi:hypothetical protein